MRIRLHRRKGLGAAIDTLAAAIQQQEGYFPPGTPGYPNGSLAYINNNPGNLAYAGQPGATNVNGDASFPTYDAGYQALINQLNLDANRGMTVGQVAAQWCPASIPGCNVPVYTNTMAGALGVGPSTLLSDAISSAIPSIPALDPATGLPVIADGGMSGDVAAGIDFTDPTTIATILAAGLALYLFVTR